MTTDNADQAEWYYEAAGSPVGPISADEFAARRSTSVITPDTTVWTNGMDDWELLRNVPAAPGRAVPITTVLHATAQCDECAQQTPKDDLLAYGNLQICTNCKDTFVDKLKQGVRVGGGPWRDRKSIVFYEDAELPPRCLKCNAPAEHSLEKNLTNVSPWLLMLILFGLPGILIYLLVAHSSRRRTTVTAYLCNGHRGQRTMLLTFNWILFSASLALMLLYLSGVIDVDYFLYVVPVSVTGFLINGILGLRIQLLRVQRIKNGIVRARGPGRKFLDSLQEWRSS